MYLDESGYAKIEKPRKYPQSDFFALAGVFLSEEKYDSCENKFLDFKHAIFPESCQNIPVHAVFLNQVGYSNKNPYNKLISNNEGKSLLKKCYEFIADLPIESIAVMVDNVALRKQYSHPDNPYELCYKFILERFQRIVKGRKEKPNRWGVINLARCSKTLTYNLYRLHEKLMSQGGDYESFNHIYRRLNIEEASISLFYEIADLVCYAYRRAYYHYLCSGLNASHAEDERYLEIIEKICTTKIGSYRLVGTNIHIKIFPRERFHKKNKD